ncbi:hypothetical protein GCM10010495_70290 [Kitasatospora herbaricolor]|nr:hypothetical protein GCM10010495_70290 [Kitasatospora herbaricolor]
MPVHGCRGRGRSAPTWAAGRGHTCRTARESGIRISDAVVVLLPVGISGHACGSAQVPPVDGPAPHGLSAGRTGVPAVTLGRREERHHRRYCTAVVRLLSSGDGFAYRNHLAVYH